VLVLPTERSHNLLQLRGQAEPREGMQVPPREPQETRSGAREDPVLVLGGVEEQGAEEKGEPRRKAVLPALRVCLKDGSNILSIPVPAGCSTQGQELFCPR